MIVNVINTLLSIESQDRVYFRHKFLAQQNNRRKKRSLLLKYDSTVTLVCYRRFNFLGE